MIEMPSFLDKEQAFALLLPLYFIVMRIRNHNTIVFRLGLFEMGWTLLTLTNVLRKEER